MASLNKLSIIGNLGADPELRFTPEGKPVVNLRIATNRSWPDGKGGWSEESIWFNATQWDDKAERIAENMRKGDQVYVEGRLKPVRVYTRNDGTMGTSLEIAAFTVLKLGKKEGADGSFEDSQVPASERTPRAAQPELDVDDIPF